MAGPGIIGAASSIRACRPRPRIAANMLKRPEYGLGAHVAPLGFTFTDKLDLGERWANGALIALHGSWNREPVAGYDVVFVKFGANGKPVDALPVTFLDQFLAKDGKTTRGIARPTSRSRRMAARWSPTIPATRSGGCRRRAEPQTVRTWARAACRDRRGYAPPLAGRGPLRPPLRRSASPMMLFRRAATAHNRALTIRSWRAPDGALQFADEIGQHAR